MKINLKEITYILTFALFAFAACNESEDIITDDAQTGGLLDGSRVNVNYVVGAPEGPYTAELFVNQGRDKVTEIRLYKSFTTTVKYTETVEGEEVERSKTFVSNEVLDKTVPVTEQEKHYVNTSWNLTELISGLKIENLAGETNDLPSDDQQYLVGDRWTFRVVSVLSDGREVQQAYNINVNVSTRYAGTYRVLTSAYYRIGVPRPDVAFPETVTIESVDAVTYRANYFGAFGDQQIFFTIDLGTGEIAYPDKQPDGTTDQNSGGSPLITCADDNAMFPSGANCGSSNYVENSDAGADKLYMTFGYNTAATPDIEGGPRTFYQVLEKIVE
jgi:hypothetical protein